MSVNGKADLLDNCRCSLRVEEQMRNTGGEMHVLSYTLSGGAKLQVVGKR